MVKNMLLVSVTACVTLVLTTVLQPLAYVQTLAQSQEECRTFRETGKTLCGKFLAYWQQHGGLMQFGYPISNPFVEKSELDGKEYKVQYFERAVFEHHPENRPPHDVLLAQLGTFRFRKEHSGSEPGPLYVENLPRYPDAREVIIKRYTDSEHPDAVMEYITRARPNEVLSFYRDVLVKDGWTAHEQIAPNGLAFTKAYEPPHAALYDLSVIVERLGPERTKVRVLLFQIGPGDEVIPPKP